MLTKTVGLFSNNGNSLTPLGFWGEICDTPSKAPPSSTRTPSARSRSRSDAPVVARSTACGSLPRELRGETLEDARRQFFEDFYAPSTRESVAAKWKTILKILELQGLSPFPPTVAKVHALGVALKYGRYRSAAGYLCQWCMVGSLLQRVIRDSTRSCVRGLGGPVRALPLPFDKLKMLPGSRDPWSPLGPISPRNLIVLAAGS